MNIFDDPFVTLFLGSLGAVIVIFKYIAIYQGAMEKHKLIFLNNISSDFKTNQTNYLTKFFNNSYEYKMKEHELLERTEMKEYELLERLDNISSDFKTNQTNYQMKFFNTIYRYKLLEMEAKATYISYICCIVMIGLICLRNLSTLSDGIGLIIAPIFLICGIFCSIFLVSITYRYIFVINPDLIRQEEYVARLKTNDNNTAK